MNFVCIVFELGDEKLTLSSMENLIVQCNHMLTCDVTKTRSFARNFDNCELSFIYMQ